MPFTRQNLIHKFSLSHDHVSLTEASISVVDLDITNVACERFSNLSPFTRSLEGTD